MTVADLSDITAYNEDVYKQGFPPSVTVFRERITAADCLLIATPEYNYGMPGVLNNAIDWASRPPDQPFDGKPMALLGASVGKLGTALAQNQLRQALVGLNGQIVTRPQVFINSALQNFDENGVLMDDAAKVLIDQIITALLEVASS